MLRSVSIQEKVFFVRDLFEEEIIEEVIDETLDLSDSELDKAVKLRGIDPRQLAEQISGRRRAVLVRFPMSNTMEVSEHRGEGSIGGVFFRVSKVIIFEFENVRNLAWRIFGEKSLALRKLAELGRVFIHQANAVHVGVAAFAFLCVIGGGLMALVALETGYSFQDRWRDRVSISLVPSQESVRNNVKKNVIHSPEKTGQFGYAPELEPNDPKGRMSKEAFFAATDLSGSVRGAVTYQTKSNAIVLEDYTPVFPSWALVMTQFGLNREFLRQVNLKAIGDAKNAVPMDESNARILFAKLYARNSRVIAAIVFQKTQLLESAWFGAPRDFFDDVVSSNSIFYAGAGGVTAPLLPNGSLIVRGLVGPKPRGAENLDVGAMDIVYSQIAVSPSFAKAASFPVSRQN